MPRAFVLCECASSSPPRRDGAERQRPARHPVKSELPAVRPVVPLGEQREADGRPRRGVCVWGHELPHRLPPGCGGGVHPLEGDRHAALLRPAAEAERGGD